MKPIFALFALCLFASTCVSFAGDASVSSSLSASSVASAAPAVPAAPQVAPATLPSPVTAAPQVAVAAPSAPPQWAQEFIVTAENLPFIGPVVSKILLYLGIVGSIATATVGFLLGVVNLLMGALNLAGLADVSSKIAAFRDGKIMYWLKFFSMFNAQKKPSDPGALSNS